jgi:hypothetical protein
VVSRRVMAASDGQCMASLITTACLLRRPTASTLLRLMLEVLVVLLQTSVEQTTGATQPTPTQPTPTQPTPNQLAPTQPTPTQQIPTQQTPTQQTPTQPTPTQPTPAQQTLTQQTLAQPTPTQPTPTQPTPAMEATQPTTGATLLVRRAFRCTMARFYPDPVRITTSAV